MNEDLKKAYTKARIMVSLSPKVALLAGLCYRLNFEFKDDVEAMATNGEDVFINPDFFMNMDEKYHATTLLQPTMHVAMLHTTRMGYRDPKLWGIAADYVVNNWLDSQGMPLPEGSLIEHRYDSMTTEEVYMYLEQNKNKQPPEPDHKDDLLEPGQGKGKGNGDDDDKQDQQGQGQAPTKEEVEESIKDKMLQAKVHAEETNPDRTAMIGSLPGELQRYFEKIDKPKLPWVQILRNWLNSPSKDKYSWQRPNRRYMALEEPMYLPSRVSKNKLDKLTFCIDVSGSIDEEQFSIFLGEVKHILSTMKPRLLNLMQFDHILQSQVDLKTIHELDRVKFTGGGGTCIQEPVLEFAKNDAKAMVMLTDGWFSFGGVVDPKKPVLWAVYDNPNFDPPFGKVVHFKLDDLNQGRI